MFGVGIVTAGATAVAACRPSVTVVSAIGEGARMAVPPDAGDEWPECPSTGPEPSTAVAAVEPAVHVPDFPTPCLDCSAEKAGEAVVSAKRRVS